MSVKALIKARRTVRKFTDKPIPENLLVSYINCARLAPSAANMQVLKYVIIQSREQVSEIMPHVKWAAYLKGAYTPGADEVPAAFIAVYEDKDILTANSAFDAGAAVMALNLAAEEDGIGCCIMGAIDKKKITGIVNAGKNLELLYMVALGYKKEHPICTDITADGDVKYYLSENQLYVPKRKMDDVLIKIM